jgi:regulatory protein
MRVIWIKAGKDPEVMRISLSDGREFSYRTAYLPLPCREGAFFTPGAELAAGDEEALRFAASCWRTERAALRLIARAEQTTAGLGRKLEHRGHASSCVQTVLRRLADLSLVSDSRYAALWLQSRLARGSVSPAALLRGLCSRGIDRDLARETVKTELNAEKESALLKNYVEKKIPRRKLRRPSADPGLVLRQKLKQEGFSSSAIRSFWEETWNG